MSYLAVQVQDYLSQPGITATALEQKAGLKRGALDSIQREQHPRPERLGQFLRALDDDTARRWLVAYLRDSCPPEWLPRLEITIAALQEADITTVREVATAYTTGQLDTSPAAVLDAWLRLQAAIQSDTSLARWFIKTVTLILGPNAEGDGRRAARGRCYCGEKLEPND